jgi:hypothetical protein
MTVFSVVSWSYTTAQCVDCWTLQTKGALSIPVSSLLSFVLLLRYVVATGMVVLIFL